MRIESDVLQVLEHAEVEANLLFLRGNLDRKLYEHTNKVLEAAGGKWNRKVKAHVFDTDAVSRVEDMLLTGEVDIPKDEFNYFPSPPKVVQLLLEKAQIEPGMLVLEPSAGQGHIAKACVASRGRVVCYELMPRNYETLSATGWYESVHLGDFLTVTPSRVFDRVVMNPPFRRQDDIRHVIHAFRFLKKGGILVSVMGAGVLFRGNMLTTGFRDWVRDIGGTLEPMEEGSFTESGTKVNTVLCTLQRPD